jgi:hypothetical protein
MSAVNTDAKVPTLLRGTNLINTGGSSSNNQVMRVKVNGKSHFVQIRLNKDGGYAAVAVQRNEIETQSSPTRTNPSGISKSKVDRPWVLFTVNADGERTYGGKGRSYNVMGEGQLGNLAGDLLPNQGKLETTTEAQALAQIGTATVNGEAVTLNQFQDLAFVKAKVLSKSAEDPYLSRQSFESGIIDAFIPAQSVSSVESIEVIPHNAEEDAVVDETVVQPGNNDPNASEPEATNTTQEFASESGDKAKDFFQGISEMFGSLASPITVEEIAQFDKIFAKGGGDKIQNGMYPLDANYGNIRGQDYVTIDQFVYQPPRRDQIFGGTITNLTKGNQRLTPLKHFLAQVKLPMPNDIQDSNQISWGPDAMNNLSAALTSGVMQNPVLVGGIGAALGSFNQGLGQMGALLAAGMAQSGGIDGVDDAKNKAIAAAKQLSSTPGGATLLKSNLGSMMLGAMGVNVSPESILNRGFGVIPNSNTELLFDNVKLRTFEFNWRMSPRDKNEADEVKKIIRFFKQGMAAKTMTSTAGEKSLYLGSPNVFRLQYRTAGGQIIEGVNRIKPVAVVGTSVNYTPDGQWSAYDEGQPVSCTLSVNMSELEPVYASDYSESVIGSRRSNDRTGTEEQFIGPFADANRAVQDIGVGDGDLYPIRPSEVGY